MLLSLCFCCYIVLYFPILYRHDEVLSESDHESESNTRIKVPPPPPLTDEGTKESDSNRTSLSDASKGTLLSIILTYCTRLPSNHGLKQITS